MSSRQKEFDSLHIGSRADGHARQHNGHVFGDVFNLMTDESEESKEEIWKQALLDWLSFAEIDHRRAQVSEAHVETFRWIFDDDNPAGFVEWLKHGQGIYWIQGKPGSGKSTLVRYLTDEPRLRSFSEQWAHPKPLIISSFWFWGAGTELQQSLHGFCRTLLYQILRQDEDYCRIAFPDWRIKFMHTDPTPETLLQAVKTVIKSSLHSTKYFFVVDGLDEYNGGSEEKTKLVENFLDLAGCPNVKLLLSSRPEVSFATGFRNYSSLCLEVLTKSDIEAYIRARLWSNPLLRDITYGERQELQTIADFIIKNAEGVFLWVVLVLQIAQTGFNDHDSFAVIRARVLNLPCELEILFKNILEKRTPPQHQVEASRYLLLVFEWWKLMDSMLMDCNILAIAQHASNYREACRLATIDQPEYRNLKSRLQSRVTICCHGLLQVGVEVEVLHKTVLDFLLQQQEAADDCYAMLKSRAGPDFNVHVALMAGFIAELKNGWDPEHLDAKDFMIEVGQMLMVNSKAEMSTGRHQTQLLDICDQNMHQRLSHLVSRKRLTHWTDAVFGTLENNLAQRIPVRSDGLTDSFLVCRGRESRGHRLKGSLLAYAILHGASLCLHEMIRENGQVLPIEEAQLLLTYAVAPPQMYANIYLGTSAYGDIRPKSLNLPVATLLLEHGADPTHGTYGHTPWQSAISWMDPFWWTQFNEIPDLQDWFSLIHRFARHTPQQSRDLAIGRDGLRLSRAIRLQALATECCFGDKLLLCTCPKARKLTQLAHELLHWIEHPM